MSIASLLRAHKRSAPPKPEVPPELKKTAVYDLGYRMGWHHAMEDAIEIAEEAEDD